MKIEVCEKCFFSFADAELLYNEERTDHCPDGEVHSTITIDSEMLPIFATLRSKGYEVSEANCDDIVTTESQYTLSNVHPELYRKPIIDDETKRYDIIQSELPQEIWISITKAAKDETTFDFFLSRGLLYSISGYGFTYEETHPKDGSSVVTISWSKGIDLKGVEISNKFKRYLTPNNIYREFTKAKLDLLDWVEDLPDVN